MNQESRQNLMTLPCDPDSKIQNYRNYIQKLVLQLTGKPVAELPIEANPGWLDITTQYPRKGSRNRCDHHN
ncbi:nitrate reductase associated protein [Aphanizomenon sp. CS-733/32]|uniref:nitrate reductase associated protein n=1 Tax=Aphanizomenon sp. CS-733/32 TaxID=3021715 RepID=UPI002FEE05CE